MQQFNHPNVLRLLGVVVVGFSGPSIVMPFMANGNLSSYLRKNQETVMLPALADSASVRSGTQNPCTAEWEPQNQCTAEWEPRTCVRQNGNLEPVYGRMGTLEPVYGRMGTLVWHRACVEKNGNLYNDRVRTRNTFLAENKPKICDQWWKRNSPLSLHAECGYGGMGVTYSRSEIQE